MLAKKYKVTVRSVIRQAEGVYTVEFASGKPFRYSPGAFLHLALDGYDPSAAWPESRCFSIQTSPSEANIKITYAVKGAFTGRMERELTTGKEVWLKLPFGELFTQSHSRQNTVFIAGGTGITPFLSLFTAPAFAEYAAPRLYLGVRNAALHLYREELQRAAEINPSLQTKIFYQDNDGVIDIEQIAADNPDAGAFFLSGPPAMLKAFRLHLLAKGVDDDRIKTDEWE